MPTAEICLSPNVTVVIDAPEGGTGAAVQKALIEGIAFWQGIPAVCPMPGCAAALVFTARHPQNYHYYGLRCEGPRPHEMNFGERKDGTSLYVKDEWRDAWTGGNDADEPAPAAAPTATPASNGAKVDQGTLRMIAAVAGTKSPKPDPEAIAQQIFGAPLTTLSKPDALAVLEYIKTL